MQTLAPGPQKRRILWLSHTLPWPAKGGLRQRSYNLMRELSRWHDVDLISFYQSAQQPNDEALLAAENALSEFAQVLAVHPLPQDRLRGGQARLAARSLFPGWPFTIRWGSCADYRASVREALHANRYDVLHFDTVSLAQYLPLTDSIPCTLNHHNIESAMLLRRAELERNGLRKLYFWQEGSRLTRYEEKIARRFRKQLVCSALDADLLTEIVGNVDTHVVPNGVDLEYFTPSARAADHRPESMIFVGGLSWYPNVSAMRFFLREVWPLLGEIYPEAALDVVGRAPPRDFLQLAERDRRVRVHGFVDEMRPMLDTAAVYVCPIFDGGGTKLKMIDALAMRKAIVAHPTACEGLDLTDGVNVLLAERPEDFVQQVGRLFANPTLRDMLGDNARRHVESHFSFRAIGKDLADLYGSLAAADD